MEQYTLTFHLLNNGKVKCLCIVHHEEDQEIHKTIAKTKNQAKRRMFRKLSEINTNIVKDIKVKTHYKIEGIDDTIFQHRTKDLEKELIEQLDQQLEAYSRQAEKCRHGQTCDLCLSLKKISDSEKELIEQLDQQLEAYIIQAKKCRHGQSCNLCLSLKTT